VSDDEILSESDQSNVVVNLREDGYSSDCSEMSSIHGRHTIDLTGKRVRKTRQELDSNRNSKVVDGCASDTDVDISVKTKRSEQQRKKRSKSSRQATKDCCVLLTVDDKTDKRRSWTDSGVSLSLSRTDQSRCGTYENGVTSKNTMDQELITPAEETKVDENNTVPLRRPSTDSTVMHQKCFNRLSQITNRSSLTNVTILTANSISSLSSVLSPSELEYVSDSDCMGESNRCSGDHYNNNNEDTFALSFARKTEIEKGSNSSMTSSVSTVRDGATKSQEELVVPSNLKDFHLKLLQSQKLVAGGDYKTNSLPTTTRRKRGSIIKRFREHFRPKNASPKNYKDVSSEFSFEKMYKDNDTVQKFEVVTPEVLKRLHAEESENMTNSYVDDVEYDNDISDEEHEDPLEKLSAAPSKDSKNFIGKFFKKSRSYSVSPQTAKRNTKESKKFNRNSLRASIRSNPEMSSKDTYNSMSKQGRYTHSMENLEMKNYQPLNAARNRSGSLGYETTFKFNHKQQISPRSRPSTLYGSHEHFLEPLSPAINAPYTPTSPRSVFDMSEFQNVHSMNNSCDCDECMYADYMDYLEFQSFKRGFYPSNSCYGPCCTQKPLPQENYPKSSISSSSSYPTSLSPPLSPFDRGLIHPGENIVAPLPVKRDKKKQATNLRTSKYESFV